MKDFSEQRLGAESAHQTAQQTVQQTAQQTAQQPKQQTDQVSERMERQQLTRPTEGVIKFDLNWIQQSIDEQKIHGLNGWRETLMRLGVLGQDPQRYEGLGFGNLSQKTTEGFVITGSQTGKLEHLRVGHFSEVRGWKIEDGWIEARGLTKPSSESLTHAAVYQADRGVLCVFHVHSEDIWQMSDKLELPSTPVEIDYGSASMAAAVKDIVSASSGAGLLAMKGHEDGILAWGGTLSETGGLLINSLTMAFELKSSESERQN